MKTTDNNCISNIGNTSEQYEGNVSLLSFHFSFLKLLIIMSNAESVHVRRIRFIVQYAFSHNLMSFRSSLNAGACVSEGIRR